MIYFIFYIYDKKPGHTSQHTLGKTKQIMANNIILECFQYIYEFLYGRTNAS